MFVDLMADLRKSVTQFFFKAQFGVQQQRRSPQRRGARSDKPVSPGSVAGLPEGVLDPRTLQTNRGEDGGPKQQPVHAKKEPGRNDPWPCGSGKKYEKCHGR